MVWMAGPLLMTLFQVESPLSPQPAGTVAQAPAEPAEQQLVALPAVARRSGAPARVARAPHRAGGRAGSPAMPRAFFSAKADSATATAIVPAEHPRAAPLAHRRVAQVVAAGPREAPVVRRTPVVASCAAAAKNAADRRSAGTASRSVPIQLVRAAAPDARAATRGSSASIRCLATRARSASRGKERRGRRSSSATSARATPAAPIRWTAPALPRSASTAPSRGHNAWTPTPTP